MTPRLAAPILALWPALLSAQGEAGAALWRVAGQTLPVPPALAEGGATLLWNPAQVAEGRYALAFAAIQGAPEIGATGVVGEARASVSRAGTFSLLFGRMQLDDLVRTTSSPSPEPASIAYYTQLFGLSWARTVRGVTVGITAAHHDTRLDTRVSGRWTLDGGAAVSFGSRIRVAAATHFLQRLDAGDAAQDVFAGAEAVVWRGQAWTDAPVAVLTARYGTTFGHGFGADHQLGAGFAFGSLAAVDVLLVYEGGYAGGGWQPVAGLALRAGKYRVGVAANPGAAGLGPAFRITLDAQFP